jgi:hypothetical protein
MFISGRPEAIGPHLLTARHLSCSTGHRPLPAHAAHAPLSSTEAPNSRTRCGQIPPSLSTRLAKAWSMAPPTCSRPRGHPRLTAVSPLYRASIFDDHENGTTPLRTSLTSFFIAAD